MNIIKGAIGFILMMAVCMAFVLALNAALDVLQYV